MNPGDPKKIVHFLRSQFDARNELIGHVHTAVVQQLMRMRTVGTVTYIVIGTVVGTVIVIVVDHVGTVRHYRRVSVGLIRQWCGKGRKTAVVTVVRAFRFFFDSRIAVAVAVTHAVYNNRFDSVEYDDLLVQSMVYNANATDNH